MSANESTPGKMVLIICPEPRIGEVQELLDEHHLEGYSELSDVRGSGKTGKRLGTRAYPGSSCMIFVVVETSRVDELLEALEPFCGHGSDAEGVRVVVLPVEHAI
jgi:nitrogen regulatory protein PII